ncbi:MAG: NUDIX hydrolase [Propionibacteriaceae bacterium]|nr:NUDIX hydrolase [Propionibacteriaceae bacterium]
MKIVLAAGTVTLREGEYGPEVLLVHRKRYDDWSLPKGKLDEGEYLAGCAVRETWEEAGVRTRLGPPLAPIEYPIVDGAKRVHYWAASVSSEELFAPNDEVDRIRWLPVEEAMRRVTYPEEPELIGQASAAADTVAVLVVRHAKAKSRIEWDEPDDERPLSKLGKGQAKRLASLFAAYGVRRLISSTAKRCRKTLAPYAKAENLQVEGTLALTEAEAWQEPDQVKTVLRRAQRQALEHREPTAVCGHAPALPLMLATLGIPYRAMEPAACVAVHFTRAGEIFAAEFIDPV